MDRELRPSRWEDFTEIKLVEMGAEVIIFHPPVSVVFENVVELFFETLVIVPSLILVCELTCPLALAPWISYTNELKAIDFSDLLDTIGMVE